MPVPKARLNWTATQALCSAGSTILASTIRPIIPNSPKARIWVVEFSNVEARDAVLRIFETTSSILARTSPGQMDH